MPMVEGDNSTDAVPASGIVSTDSQKMFSLTIIGGLHTRIFNLSWFAENILF
jgi:hypothetical protein